MNRPLPPSHLHMPDGSVFEPAPDLRAFLYDAFILEGAPFHREEYSHLVEAKIGVLWTNRERVKNGLHTLGMAQLYRTSGDKWTAGVGQQQIAEWFAHWWPDAMEPEPDFILYFYAPYVAQASDPSALALFAHELRHCAHKRDIQGHDVEQFVSVVEDFGIEAAGQAGVAFVEAAQKRPRFSAAEVAGICGCGARLQAVA